MGTSSPPLTPPLMSSSSSRTPPADPEMGRNIEVLAAFAVKNGPQFEQLARTKTAGDPKFDFLLGGSPGTPAAHAKDFYEWTKQRLQSHTFDNDIQKHIYKMAYDVPSPPPPIREASSKNHQLGESKPSLSADVQKRKTDGAGVRRVGNTKNSDSDSFRRVDNHHEVSGTTELERGKVERKESTAVDKVSSVKPNQDDSVRTPVLPSHGARDIVEAERDQMKKAEVTDKERSNKARTQHNISSRGTTHGSRDPAEIDKSQCKTTDSAAVSTADKAKEKFNVSPVQGAKGITEVEMGQEANEESEKLSREARGLKLLRTALAEYVKEELKPTWKEGHMSKDAYKNIVKKVVDKVVSTVQGHQVPKSQENVDQYMAQSRTKIAKLVQGYVERFKKN